MLNITRDKLEEFLAKLRLECGKRGEANVSWGVIGPTLIVDIIIDGLRDSYCIYNSANGGVTFDRIWNGVI